MNRAEMLEELQTVINDDPAYQEWAESTLLGYLSEGQDKFCEDTGYFIDISNYSVTLQTGVAMYAIPDRIIQILNVYEGTSKLNKVLTGSEYDESGSMWVEGSGRPARWRTDKETGAIHFSPTPSAAENDLVLTLHVWRYSQYDLAGTQPRVLTERTIQVEAVPEIPARFHRAIIEWAAFKAFNHHDAETQDPVKAVEHLANYKAYVSDAVTAFRRQHGIECRITSNAAYRT